MRKGVTLIFAAAFSMAGCNPSPHNKDVVNRTEYSEHHSEKGPLGKSVSFESLSDSAPATFTISCNQGGSTDFSVKLDDEPKLPPPLRGVYGTFHLNHKPGIKLELGYLMGGTWSPREGQSSSVDEVIGGFLTGEKLMFSLPPPNGNGNDASWAVRPIAKSELCSSDNTR